NPANDVNRPVPGWPTLARVMAETPDFEAFASFKDLGVKSLLLYQAELIFLRKALHKQEWQDQRQSGLKINSAFANNLQKLIEARDKSIAEAKPGQPEELPKQWVLIEKIRSTLDKYNSALLQFSEVAALKDADRCNTNTLKKCVRRAGKDRVALTGDGAFAWGNYKELSGRQKSIPQLFWGLFTGFFVSAEETPEEQQAVYREHLVEPRRGNPPDGLTIWVKRSFIPFYEQLVKKYQVPISENHENSPHTPSSNGTSPQASIHRANSDASKSLDQCQAIKKSLTAYSGNWILRVTSIMTTAVACLLPTVAITVLAKVHSMGLILGLIALFTALFAIGLALLSSSSSRVDIFTASAAFSAVMVVFVQNQ
ncbi:hypothetical protein DL98DRAFT_369384, partial [Cadophora sp. DSE1049]